MHQIMAFVNTGFTAAFTPHWVALEMDPPNPALQALLRDWGRERILERHDKLEEMISDTPFLVGDKPTLADAVFIGVARWLDFHAIAHKSRWPKMAALRERLEAAVNDCLHWAGSGRQGWSARSLVQPLAVSAAVFSLLGKPHR